MDEDTTTPRDAAVMDPPTLAIDNSSLDSSDRTSEKRSRSPEPEPEAVAEAVEVAATPSSPVLDPVIENNPEAPRQTKDDEEPKDSSLSDVRAKSPEQVQDMSTLSQASYGPIQPTEVESQAHANVFDNSKGLETAAAIDSPSAKRRRISLPGKSILKPNQTDDTGTFSNHDPQEDTMTGNHDDFPSADVTETFSSITDFQKRNRKSFGRRVSFAATARIRMFERDEKEEEMPKTTSFIEGLNPRITLEYPFTFRTRTGNDGNNPDTLESSTSAEDLHEQSQPDTVSSESERDNERSFEVNVLPSHSDSTSSSGVTTTSYFARSSSEDTTGKSPFDDNEDQGFSSEDDTGIFYTESDSMRRLSSSDIYDSILGPRLQFAPRSQSQLEMSDDFGERGSMQEDTDDFSMMMQDFNNDDSLNLKFSKHRSSIPEPLRGPLLSNDNGDTQDFSKPSEGAGTSTYTSQMSEHSGLVTDEDTDMDITSPIGVGIHALAQEEPPKTFAQDEDNTEIFSDGGTTMEMTLPIGHGIVQISGESTSANSESHASLDWQGMNSGVNGVTGSSSSPPTHSAGLTHEFQKENATYSTRPHDDEPQQPPSTPPRRVSLLREGASLPSTPRRSLGTPGKFTSKTHAQLNVFLDNVERQLKSVESCAPAPPIYRVSHVSPETSNLTKRIARYSIGTTFSAPESIQDRLASMQDTNPDDNTMDFDQAFLSQQIPHEDSIFDERITLAGASQLSTQPSQLTQPSQPSQSSDLFQQSQSLPVTRPFMGSNITTERRVVDATQDDNVESTADESFGELPPITLNKFLGLIGISFLEFSVTSRRRTLPPKPVVADSSMDDILTQMTCLLAEVESYKNGCGMLKSFVEDSRKMTAEVEQQVNDENPDFIREYREGDGVFKEFVKERLKLLRAHCRLETFESFHYWRDDLYVYQQETLEYHKAKLGEDTSTVRKIGKSVSQLSEHVTKRHAELKRQLEEFRQRKSSFAQYDKDRMASLAEDIEEQGSQLEQFRTIVVNKRKEQAEIAAKEEQTRLIEQGFVERIAVAEKTIEEHSFAKPEDIVKSKNALSALQAIHGWEQLGQSSLPMSVTSATALQNGATKLEFVHDRSLKASIDMSKVGKVDSNNTDNPAIQLSLLEDEGLTFGLSLAEGPKMSIRGTAPKALVSLKEYAGLLKDFSSMIASKYSTNVGISKILYDINLYWTKVKSIYRQVEQVRARHTVDLVAGSAENLKELEANNNNNNNGNNNSSNNDGVTNNQNGRRPTTAPIVLLDIRVLFLFSAFGSSWKKKTTTTKKKKISKSTRQQNRGHHQGQDDGDGHMTDEENESHEPAEPFKFYIWFTFTLDDLMNFPAPNSLTWRLEVVYGNISRNQIAEAVAPCIKKGGYNMLREACKNINGLKKQ